MAHPSSSSAWLFAGCLFRSFQPRCLLTGSCSQGAAVWEVIFSKVLEMVLWQVICYPAGHSWRHHHRHRYLCVRSTVNKLLRVEFSLSCEPLQHVQSSLRRACTWRHSSITLPFSRVWHPEGSLGIRWPWQAARQPRGADHG